jgi:hypothetical protein
MQKQILISSVKEALLFVNSQVTNHLKDLTKSKGRE